MKNSFVRRVSLAVAVLGSLLAMAPVHAAAPAGWATPIAGYGGNANWQIHGCAGSTAYTAGRVHIGSDVGAAIGTSVSAIGDGTTVLFLGDGGQDEVLQVRHRGADGTEFLAIYGHIDVASRFTAANVAVVQGDVLGAVKAHSGGNHLHFGIAQTTAAIRNVWGTRGCAGGEPPINSANNGVFRPSHDFLAQHPRTVGPQPSQVWGVNSGGAVYRHTGGSDWTRVLGPGSLLQLDVGPNGVVWGVNSAGGVYRRVSGSDFARISPNGSLVHVSIGPDGQVWGVNSGGAVYKHTGGSNWARVLGPGSLVQLDVGPNGVVWGVNSAGGVYRRTTGSDFVRISPNGSLVHVSIGRDGQVWGVNSGGSVYKYTGGSNWARVLGPGSLVQVDVGPNGVVWGVNSAGGVYRGTSGSDFVRISPNGSLVHVSIGS